MRDAPARRCPPRFLTVDEVGVVAALAQLHHGVEEVGHVGVTGAFGKEGEILLQDGPVIFLLNVGQLHLNDGFLLGRQVLLHVFLQPTEHHGLEDGLELLHLQGGPAGQRHRGSGRTQVAGEGFGVLPMFSPAPQF